MSIGFGRAGEVGAAVVYRPGHGGPGEHGVVVGVRGLWVHVRYRGDATPKATSPADLDWATSAR